MNIDLFRKQVKLQEMNLLRDALENGFGVIVNNANILPNKVQVIPGTVLTSADRQRHIVVSSIHVVCEVLIQYLYELPEPLLGYDHYDAMISVCQELDDVKDRIRNLSLLIHDTPWYNK